jgi:hypothetical protein
MSILKNPAAILWRKQFKAPDDFATAGKLMSKFKFVPAQEFKRDMRRLILTSIPASEKAAFYIERELQLVTPHWAYKRADGRAVKNKSTRKIAVRMYEEAQSERGAALPKRWTASGSALPAVKSPKNLRQEVGSEGIVAALVSRLCLKESTRFVMHPHTTALRRMKVQHLVIVTDLIGSGKRTREMLDSLWRVASVRSWVSSGYLRLSVFCYSATELGLREVRRHPGKPTVTKVRPCPTISNSFNLTDAITVENLCRRFPARAKEPLGFKDIAALIAFEHSCPNNVPAMFTQRELIKSATWNPLFPTRSADEFSQSHKDCADEEQLCLLEAIKCANIATNPAFTSATLAQRATILLLAAIYRGRRNSDDIVATTGLSLIALLDAWKVAQLQGLLTSSGRLTFSGLKLIVNLNRPTFTPPQVPITSKINYYPSSLREPVVGS